MIIGTDVRFFWYGPETSQQIVAAFLAQPRGAYLKFALRQDTATGEIKLDWSIPIQGVTTAEGNGIPGGNDSHVCPPVCP